MSEASQVILIVDDSAEDREMITLALRKAGITNPIANAPNGADALDYLKRSGSYADRQPGHPVLILLDIKMPKVDGISVLQTLKRDLALAIIPTVIFTSSAADEDLSNCYRLGANAFVQKPVDYQKFFATVACIGMFWIEVNSTD